jgi:sugar phosphate isomerase/epimerase
MQAHWNNYCAMSIVNFMAFPETGGGEGPIVESVRKIAEDSFFEAIEIAWINDAGVRRDVRHILQASQLQVGFCAHPAVLSQRLNLNSLDHTDRFKAIRQMQDLIDQAYEMGASHFVFLSGPDPGEARREAAMTVFLDSVHQMCDYARARGIGLTLETFDRNVDKKCLIGPVRAAAKIAQGIRKDYPDFGLLYDSSHMPLLDETPSDMFVIKEYLVHVHVGNCVKVKGSPLYGDLHPYFGFAGSVNGVDQLAEFIRGLVDIDYLAEGRMPRPWVGFEVKPQGPGQTPELIIANAKRVWQQAWARA